jgi:hypothetical protein
VRDRRVVPAHRGQVLVRAAQLDLRTSVRTVQTSETQLSCVTVTVTDRLMAVNMNVPESCGWRRRLRAARRGRPGRPCRTPR